MFDLYETYSQYAIDQISKAWQRCREDGMVAHVCRDGARVFLTDHFFEHHWDDRHVCEYEGG